MQINLVGFTYFDYEKNGVPVKGANLYCLEDIPKEKGFGKKIVGSFVKGAHGAIKCPSITDSVFPREKLSLGDYEIFYNEFGNIATMRKL